MAGEARETTGEAAAGKEIAQLALNEAGKAGPATSQASLGERKVSRCS
jgi:hypothetical protein